MDIISFTVEELIQLVEHQIKNLFRIDSQAEGLLLRESILKALAKCERCFSATLNKYYNKEGTAIFNPYHSGQYTIFLYFLSRSIFRSRRHEAKSLADRVYFLNRALNAVDLFYEVELPDIFFLDHPVGSVMGRAVYGECFRFAQNCTVGNNKGVYPGDFQERCHSLAATQAAWVNGSSRIGSGSSVGLLIHTSAG